MDTPRRAETLEEALHRLCAKGHAEGCAVLDEDYAWFPQACRVRGSDGVTAYVVNLMPGHPLHGCDCDGYERWQRCKHYAMALEVAGLLPDLPDAPELVADREARARVSPEERARRDALREAWTAKQRDAAELELAAAKARTERTLAAMDAHERRAAAADDLAKREKGARAA